MVEEKNEQFFANKLQILNLSEDEALVYFTLLKYGKQGNIVRKLKEELPSIERTRLYSILRKLIEEGYAIEGPPSDDARKPKTFIAKEPLQTFNSIYEQMEKKLENLQKFRETILPDIINFYDSGIKVSFEELSFKSLIKRGWKIKDQKVVKGLNLFGGKEYQEYILFPPNKTNELINTVGILFSFYASEIKDVELQFFEFQIENMIRKLHEDDFNVIIIDKTSIEMFGKEYPSLSIKARGLNKNGFIEFGMNVILPLEKEIIFIWEEIDHEKEELEKEVQSQILKETVGAILKNPSGK